MLHYDLLFLQGFHLPLLVAVDTVKTVDFLKWCQTQDYMEPKNMKEHRNGGNDTQLTGILGVAGRMFPYILDLAAKTLYSDLNSFLQLHLHVNHSHIMLHPDRPTRGSKEVP